MAKIIHIDDEESITALIKGILEEEGHEITSFNDLRLYLRHIHHTDETIDLVIFDGTINKPLDGRMEAEKVQHWRDKTGKGPRAILLTGDSVYTSNSPGFENLKKVGKPPLIDELIDAVNEVLAT